MRNKPTSAETARDSALDDDFGIDRALVLIKRMNYVYGRDKATRKVLEELTDILIGVRQRARKRHQEAERKHLEDMHGDEIAAQLL
jgi:hypothetical protein